MNEGPLCALPPVPPQSVSSPRDEAALRQLATQARHHLATLNVPPPAWSIPAKRSNGQPALDVLVVGAGMCGQTAAFALVREGVTNMRIIDRAPRGLEGPWGTHARMLTLRSPKHLTGPDLGVQSLTFRAWYTAQHGEAGWESLYKIGRLDWRDYLLWVRDTVGIEVDNGVGLTSFEPDGELVRAQLHGPHGDETVWARRIVLALGREGSGAPRWPAYPSLRADDPCAAGRVFHSSEDIDFQSLRGRKVAVLGAGASAFDNAATALEAGATVIQFARRATLPQVNKGKAVSFPGFFEGFEKLPDALRWRYYTYIFEQQVPPPWETVRRCDASDAFELRLGETWLDVSPQADCVLVKTPNGALGFDVVIFGTGFDVDLLERPEVAPYADIIDTWGRHVTPDEAARHAEAARFPYLGHEFQLCANANAGTSADAGARNAARIAMLGRIHVFNWGSTLSHGALAGDIPGLGAGALRLGRGIAGALFVEDFELHWQRLQSHSEPELQYTRWYASHPGRFHGQ